MGVTLAQKFAKKHRLRLKLNNQSGVVRSSSKGSKLSSWNLSRHSRRRAQSEQVKRNLKRSGIAEGE